MNATILGLLALAALLAAVPASFDLLKSFRKFRVTPSRVIMGSSLYALFFCFVLALVLLVVAIGSHNIPQQIHYDDDWSVHYVMFGGGVFFIAQFLLTTAIGSFRFRHS